MKVIATPTEHEKKEWSRLARDAYSRGRNEIGHRYSAAASLPRDAEMSSPRFTSLMRDYQAWLVDGFDSAFGNNPRKKRGKLHGAAKAAFLARMAKGRKRAKNPGKLDRCVKAVRKRRSVKNAYAVCTASFKRSKRVRRRNAKGYALRHGHYLVAVRGSTRLYYDGRHFSGKGSARLYPSSGAAAAIGKGLVRHYPVLRGYRLYVGRT